MAVLGSTVHFQIGPQETLIILSVPHTDSAMVLRFHEESLPVLHFLSHTVKADGAQILPGASAVQRFANSENHCPWCFLGQDV